MTIQIPPTRDLQSLEWFALFRRITEAINVIFQNGLPRLPSHTVASAPSASDNPRAMIYVSDETGGAVPAFSDGTNWRRVTDRAIIS